VLKGKHTTDEFLTDVWREFAVENIRAWNGSRRKKLSDSELLHLAANWLDHRIERARRFSGSPVRRESLDVGTT
jgi:hypothetical protein